jgi:hypothetical protein
MANRWGIPLETEEIVKKRDLRCVYCGIEFTSSNLSRKSKPTWEHIINDIRLNSPENIAICCFSCNASKGSKKLEDWLESKYCYIKRISAESVAPVVKLYFDKINEKKASS